MEKLLLHMQGLIHHRMNQGIWWEVTDILQKEDLPARGRLVMRQCDV